MFKLPDSSNCNILIIGLGYVGLPLAVEFAKTSICKDTGKALKRNITGYDINSQRINDLKNGIDITNELNDEEISFLNNIELVSELKNIKKIDVFIVTVPTPIDSSKNPNLKPLKDASITVGKLLKRQDTNHPKTSTPIVIYESTVYPGATEEVCVPIIEEFSNLKFNKDFFCGYSPERINPGDKNHKLSSIKKITSGSSNEAANWVNSLYSSIIEAGTFLTKSIKTAEAAKVIENTQRDLNIALVNEFAMIFQKIGVNSLEVLEAAGTKWNFLDFKPGLVGGHCIGVDPYYLTYKAKIEGCEPHLVLAGRKINDEMGIWIANLIIEKMFERKIEIKEVNILILGITFKENCPDIRNSKVFDLVNFFSAREANVDIVDPIANYYKNMTLNINISRKVNFKKKYQVIIAAVSHNEFKKISLNDWEKILDSNNIILDIKGFIPKELKPIRI